MLASSISRLSTPNKSAKSNTCWVPFPAVFDLPFALLFFVFSHIIHFFFYEFPFPSFFEFPFFLFSFLLISFQLCLLTSVFFDICALLFICLFFLCAPPGEVAEHEMENQGGWE